MTDIDRKASRMTYWNALMDVLAERAIRGDAYVNPEWDAMERRLLRRYWLNWRRACEPEEMKEAA